ncbi:hypothetical protein MG290_04360 [Flavobacterium sp. CBA20B-1]|uniref:hypothetical protein n=1 Tax=unclassified Flavobacterium TaxID=196869 RepID=UPI0022258CA6|nr:MULTISPECIES: hypothetical protein [unclassified Flavobacterium]WCM42923.1 hypothetical protein MG290_04360 [Flavobacterium sp. CBA20B-1]
MVSCSNDAETTNTPENQNVTTTASRPLPPVENATDEMFRDYVTSDIFIEVHDLTREFVDDMNYEGSVDDIRGTDQMLSWIAANLSTTNFSSVEEAETRYNHILARKRVEISSFAPVYEFIKTAPLAEI